MALEPEVIDLVDSSEDEETPPIALSNLSVLELMRGPSLDELVHEIEGLGMFSLLFSSQLFPRGALRNNYSLFFYSIFEILDL